MPVSETQIIEMIRHSGAVVDLEQLTPSSSLHDFGLDSMDMANVLLEIEETLGFKIPDDDVLQLDSISSIVSYVNTRLEGE